MTTHQLCEVARKGEPCNFCHAAKGQPCTADRPGVHLCRICLAATDGLATMLDAVSVIHGDVFAGWDLILDTGAA